MVEFIVRVDVNEHSEKKQFPDEHLRRKYYDWDFMPQLTGRFDMDEFAGRLKDVSYLNTSTNPVALYYIEATEEQYLILRKRQDWKPTKN